MHILQHEYINYMVNILILLHVEIFVERLADFGDRPDPHKVRTYDTYVTYIRISLTCMITQW